MAIFKLSEAFTYSGTAGEDLRLHLHKFVNISNSDGRVVLVDSGIAIGTVIEVANTDEPVSIQTGGITKAVAGGSINAGAKVKVTTDGAVVAWDSGDFVGVALTGADSGDVIPVRMV